MKGEGQQILKETFCPRLGMGKSRGLGLTTWERGGGWQPSALSLQTCLCQLSWFQINLQLGGGSTQAPFLAGEAGEGQKQTLRNGATKEGHTDRKW